MFNRRVGIFERIVAAVCSVAWSNDGVRRFDKRAATVGCLLECSDELLRVRALVVIIVNYYGGFETTTRKLPISC